MAVFTEVSPAQAQALLDHLHLGALSSLRGIDAGIDKLQKSIPTLMEKLHAMEKADEGAPKAIVARQLRLETMVQVREVCDSVEGAIPPEMWTLATYKELLFLDSHHGTTSIAEGMGALEVS